MSVVYHTALPSSVTATAEIETRLSDLDAAIAARQTAITTEASRATGVETSLQAQITTTQNEITAARPGYGSLLSRLNADTAAWGTADAELQDQIDAEATARLVADSAEAGTRATADRTEASARAAGDQTERSARIAADSALNRRVDNVSNANAMYGGVAVAQLTRRAAAAKILNIGGNGTLTTVNFATPHGFAAGDYLAITGVSGYNDTRTEPINVISTTQITYASTVNAATATPTAGYAAATALFVDSIVPFRLNQWITLTNDPGEVHDHQIVATPASGILQVTPSVPIDWTLLAGTAASTGGPVSSTLEAIRAAQNELFGDPQPFPRAFNFLQRNVINVLAYTAVRGDDANDDGPGLNALIDSAPAGSIIDFGNEGHIYRTTETLNLKGNLQYRGEACIRAAQAVNLMSIAPGEGRIRLEGLELDGNIAALAASGYVLNNLDGVRASYGAASAALTKDVVIEGLRVHDIAGYGISMGTGFDGTYITYTLGDSIHIHDCEVWNTHKHAVRLFAAERSSIKRNRIHDITTSGTDATPLANTTLTQNAVAGTSTIYVASTANFAANMRIFIYLNDGTVHAVKIDTIGSGVLNLKYPLAGAASIGNQVRSGLRNLSNGILAGRFSHGLKVIENWVWNILRIGIEVNSAGGAALDCDISKNHVWDTTRFGLSMARLTNASVTDNHMRRTKGLGLETVKCVGSNFANNTVVDVSSAVLIDVSEYEEEVELATSLDGRGFSINSCQRCSYTDNKIEDVGIGYRIVRTTQPTAEVVQDINIQAGHIFNTTGPAIEVAHYLANMENLTIQGTQMRDNERGVIYHQDTQAIINLHINNISAVNIGPTPGSDGAAFAIRNVTDGDITNNIFRLGTGAATRGVEYGTGMSGVLFDNNHIADDFSDPFQNNSGTGAIIGHQNYGWKTRNKGLSSTTPGAVTSYTIAHGLNGTPTYVNIKAAGPNARSAPAYYVAGLNASTFTIFFASALTAGQAYSWFWEAER
jgi:hypothetical protein